MDTLTHNSRKIWPFIAGGCALLVLLACGASAALGIGGTLLFSRHRQDTSTQRQPPASQLSPEVAELTGLQGWVEVQDQGQWQVAIDGQLVCSGQHVRTGEMSSVALRFNDGSQASLDASSELSIDELNAAKADGTRTVILTQWAGQSEHQVARNEREDSRYVVNTSGGTGEAHGTVFRVTVTPEGVSRYMVVEGTVAVTSLEVTVLVQAGQVSAIYLGQTPLEPVASVTTQGEVSQIGDTWIIADQSFIIDEHSAIVGNPQVGDWALVEGHLLDGGTSVADWIVLIHSSQTNRFSLNGEVDETSETVWTINEQKIYVTSDTETDAGIVAGDLVRVEGVILDDGRLEAENIRLQEVQDGLPFEFSGVVQEMNAEDWLISGHKVRVEAEITIPDELAAGDIVLVRGRIQEDGTWLASSITQMDEQSGHFRFSGTLESIDPWQVAGISFETRDWTVISADLEVGNLVQVEGEIDTNGTWVANEVVRLDAETARMVLIGTVVNMDPWIVNGVTLRVTSETEILGDVAAGSLVRVELVLGEDGQWYALRIEPLPGIIALPTCIDLVARVVSVDGNQIQFENWPLMPLGEDAQIEGVIIPGNVVRFRLCFDEDGQIMITYIIIIEQDESEPPETQVGKVQVCHKPDKKKGGHTLSIDAAALPAHLGHGDYEGPCR
jgi:hypothetical protein